MKNKKAAPSQGNGEMLHVIPSLFHREFRDDQIGLSPGSKDATVLVNYFQKFKTR